MTTKDWILLFVPIIANGILLAIFQEILKRRFKKTDKIRGIVDRFNEKIFKLIEQCNEIVITTNKVTPQELMNKIDYLGQELWNLQRYADSYNVLQTKYNKKISECVERYNSIVALLKKGLLNEAEYEFGEIEKILRYLLNESIS